MGSRSLTTLLVFLCTPAQAVAQVPSFRDVVGHDVGERITTHRQMETYLRRLADASPRVTIESQGQSWEGRELLLAIVTAPDNHARLGQIQANAQRLGDPRSTPENEAVSIFPNQPVVMWFGGSIHGNELSGSEAALRLLERLSTMDDEATLAALRNTVVLIDPMLNPDGRDAFVARSHENAGRVPQAEVEDWTHDFTPWESARFRTGHYFFDNNRDWFATTQPETRLRLPTILAWRPQTMVDMHEMGPNQEFFFYPGAPPTSPHVPAFALEWIRRFATEYAVSFDAAGFEYMTREAFDYFYPGYTDGYGSLQGAVGMLYEQGSTRGLALERDDGSVRRYADAIEQQYTAAWAAVAYGSNQRDVLLREYYDALVAAVASADSGMFRYFIGPEGDPGLQAELANLLLRAGVDVETLTESAELRNMNDRMGQLVGSRRMPAGTYVVSTAQPRAHLIRALLDPDTPVPSDFLEDARARVERGADAELYDVTAWSLPLLFNVGAYATADDKRLVTQPVTYPARAEGAGVVTRATYAYLLDGRHAASAAALYHLSDGGYRVAVTLQPSSINGVAVPSGTGVVWVGPNGDEVHDRVREVAAQFSLNVRAVPTGLGDEGFPSLGSADVVAIRTPKIAILGEDPVQAMSFGWAWYTLDRLYEIPTTVIRARSVSRTPIADYDVLVVPSSGELTGALGNRGIERLKNWVRDGGTLVTIGGATDFAIDEEGLDLIDLKSWYDEDDADDSLTFDVPGAILRGTLDPDLWLSAGYPDSTFPVLATGSRIYLPPDGPPSRSRRIVGRYVADSTQIRMSGQVWNQTVARLGNAVFAYEQRVGRGRVIAFAEDLNFRGYWRGSDRLFLNAVLLGPSAP